MRLWSNSFRDGGLIPDDYAFARIDPLRHVAPAGNRNPHLAWDETPPGAESLALFCIDVDAPRDTSNANCPGLTLPMALLRSDFYHWSVLDVPLFRSSIGAGELSREVTPRGKAQQQVLLGVDGNARRLRQGLNDYTGRFAGDPDMAGDYYGYDGPAPPWNDERIHHYIFRLYALDAQRVTLPPRFTGAQARAALHGHILDEAQLVGAYSLNPALAATLTR